ncbi:MAG: histidine phosphatase family protein [Pyramidobacter sp.]|nr:histidine phosphatase family protein [Pyramidobacter sp.]
MRLFIVRHGETAWNREGRFQGQIDTPLNEKGLAQADLTAERFRGFPLQAVLASPLSRARVTGEKIYAAAKCDSFVIDDGFKEINHGEWEGKTTAEVIDQFGPQLAQWQTQPHLVKMPGPAGEALEDVQRRAVAAVERHVPNYTDDVLLATHDAVIKTVICHYLGVPLANYWRVKIPNCSVSYIEFGPSGPLVGLMGDISHLGTGFDSFVSMSL